MSDDWPDVGDFERAVDSHREHPAVKQWFRGITAFEDPMPGLGIGTFLMVEFRDGQLGALAWSDGPGTWGTGGWRPLSADGSFSENITRMPPVIHGRTFAEVLDAIVSLRKEAVPPSTRPWWRFWE